jgi:hypothetical protein
MNGTKSREAAIQFLEYLEKKGLMAPATAQARKAALNMVLGILEPQEAQDVTSINLDDVMARFQNLQGKSYTPDSLRAYKSRVKSALNDFASYLENPLAFKPSVQTRERKPNPSKPLSDPARSKTDHAAPNASQPTGSAVSEPMATSIIPIQIRADLTIRIQGLPFDLTEAEARKIANVIQAMATPI